MCLTFMFLFFLLDIKILMVFDFIIFFLAVLYNIESCKERLINIVKNLNVSIQGHKDAKIKSMLTVSTTKKEYTLTQILQVVKLLMSCEQGD